MEFELRDKIDNQFIVTEKHRGGMSVVYIVLDEFSQRRFAVKTLREELLADRNAISRFAAEARTWMHLGHHENIVEAIIYREIEGQPFLFLEYVEGTNLQALIDQEGRLFPPQVLRFMEQAAAAMAYVHQAKVGPSGTGVIHRDLKPANLMLTRQAILKITDFGLAKAQGMPGEHSDVGVGLGTYLYMPPEQLLDASAADWTSDIYSFGACFYAALTGRPPIQGKDVSQLVRQIIHQMPARPSQIAPGIPAELDELIMRCLAKQRQERFQSFAELQKVLPAVQEAVAAAHSGRKEVWQCTGCGYLSTNGQGVCPICANPRHQTGFPPSGQLVSSQKPEPAAAPPTAEISAEEEAVAELMAAARSWREKGDWQRAANVLRQALALAPGHKEARQALDETLLALARQKPRTPSRSYNWPMFRGSITRVGYTPEVVVPPLQLRWHCQLGEWILASPIVANGIVYTAAHQNKPGKQGRLVALTAERGEIVWEKETPYDILAPVCVWGGNMLIAACHNWLIVLEPQTGKQIWDFVTRTPITAPPTSWQNAIYVGTEEGALYVLHGQSGQRMWTFAADGPIYSAALIWEGRVIFGAGDHQIYALEQSSGKLLWHFMTAGEIVSTPLLYQGRIYAGSTDQRLYCLDFETGRCAWEFATTGSINSSPAAWQDYIYIGARDHCLYAVSADKGTLRWRFQAGDWIDSAPIVSGRTVYFGSHDGKLYATETEVGILMWEYPIGAELPTSPAISGGKLFIAGNDGKLYCFRSL